MIVLDLSRLLSRAGRETPTGIDRVELAYAEHLIATDPAALFATTTLAGGLGLVPRRISEGFVAAIGAAWRSSTDTAGDQRKVRRLGWRGRLAALAGGEARLFAGLRHFFFQAEDGIRAGHVTGVQTCALPISRTVYAADITGHVLIQVLYEQVCKRDIKVY